MPDAASAPSQQAAMVTDPQAMVILRVIAGRQVGACMHLQVGHIYSIGSSVEHDIVLRDNSEQNNQLSVQASGLCVFIGGKGSNRFDYGEAIKLGESVIQIDAPEKSDFDQADYSSAQHVNLKRPADSSYRVLRVGGLSVIGFVLLGMAFSFATRKPEIPSVGSMALESRLSNASLDELQVERVDGKIILTGYVATRDQAIRVAEFVARQPETLLNRISVDEEIRDHIDDVLRTNGVEGSVDSMGQGVFVAQTKIGSPEKLAQLKALLEKDVPSARSVSLYNEVPTPKKITVSQPTPRLDAGKRVVMVNSDRPAYVVTQDQSRYFVGSMLPGGFRISAITNGRVTVEKQGVKTELKF